MQMVWWKALKDQKIFLEELEAEHHTERYAKKQLPVSLGSVIRLMLS